MPKVTDLTESLTIADSDYLYAVVGGNSRKVRKDTLIPLTVVSAVKLQAAVAAASQPEIDFTGVPTWVNRITVMLDDLSTNGTSPVQIQLGDSGGIETTNYRGAQTSFGAAALTTTNAGAGAQVETGSIPVAAAQRNGSVTISRVSGNTWSIWGAVGQAQATSSTVIAVNKTLSAALDRVRITTVNGTDTFDAGSVSISWE